MYDRNLSIKEIAERVRHFAKKQYPACKFSITTQSYSGGQSMHVALMSAPFDPFATPDINAIPHGRHNTPEQEVEYWANTINRGHHQVNQYYIADDFRLSAEGKACMQFVKNAMTVYNYDDSDSQIDYFNTNFYSHIAVGKWDKPFTLTK